MRLRLMRIPLPRTIFGAPRASKCPAGAELLKGRLVQRPHIKIAFSPPFMARLLPESLALRLMIAPLFRNTSSVKRKFW